MKSYQEFVAEAKKCWPGYKKKGTKKLFGKTYNNCVKEEIELEESSTGEKTRGKATLARGRGADMTRQERTTAAIAKKAGLKGTGKYSTKDLRTPTGDYTNSNYGGYGNKGSTKLNHYVTTHASPRSAATSSDLDIINKEDKMNIIELAKKQLLIEGKTEISELMVLDYAIKIRKWLDHHKGNSVKRIMAGTPKYQYGNSYRFRQNYDISDFNAPAVVSQPHTDKRYLMED